VLRLARGRCVQRRAQADPEKRTRREWLTPFPSRGSCVHGSPVSMWGRHAPGSNTSGRTSSRLDRWPRRRPARGTPNRPPPVGRERSPPVPCCCRELPALLWRYSGNARGRRLLDPPDSRNISALHSAVGIAVCLGRQGRSYQIVRFPSTPLRSSKISA
jgi:hypothetical protein